MTINVRQAVEIARNHFESVKDLFGQQINDIRLEEIEFTEDEKYWLITIGFNRKLEERPRSKDEPFDALRDAFKMPYRYDREYKTLEVNAETGQVKAIKIRAL